MGEREALLRAVCENPDDDLPRLVFADWLEEHGEPERAEFIRAEIELDHRPGYPDDYGPEHNRLSSRLIAYLNKWEWRRDLSVKGDVEVMWSRGFADSLRCNAREWLVSAIAILSLHPMRKVELGDLEDIPCLKLFHEPSRPYPWKLNFYQAFDDLAHSSKMRFPDRHALITACPQMTDAWLREYDIAFIDP